MGYYAKYYSTLLRGLGPTVFKIRWNNRKLVNEVRKEDAMIYKKIINLIQEHKVTKGLRNLGRLKKMIKRSVDRAEVLIFNIITVDRQGEKAKKEFLDALTELSKQAGKIGQKNVKLLLDLEEGIAKVFAEETKKQMTGERGEYKMVMEIMNTAGKGHEEFMDRVRLSLQKYSSQTFFAKWAMRSEIKSEKRDILILQAHAEKIRNYIKKAIRETHSTKAQYQVVKELQGSYEHIINAVRDFQKESYLLKKRDLLLVIKILVNVDLLKQQLEKWKKINFLPPESADEIIDFVNKEVEGRLVEGFRAIAQGFRILIHDTEEDYKEAQKLIASDIAVSRRAARV